VSRHLRVLRDAGIVAVDAVGRARVYRLTPHGASALETVEPGGATRWTFTG